MHFSAILLTIYLLACAAAALPRPAVGILPSPKVSKAPSHNTLLTLRSTPGSGLSGEFIATMNPVQLERLSTRLRRARDTTFDSVIKQGKLGQDTAQLILRVEDARFRAAMGSMDAKRADELADMLQYYGEAVAQLEDTDKSVVAMKELFEELSP